jgi:hypothetical protein
MNVCKLGNVANHSQLNDPFIFSSIYNIIATYVDDLIIGCDDINIIERFKQQLASTYKVKDMGEINWYLDMRFIRNKETNAFTLNQLKTAQNV